jgi:hypothetical protein
MKNLTHCILPVILTTVFGVSVLTQAAEIRVPVLQAKLDRLYFGAGQEADIFAGSPFLIECHSVVLFSGRIEQSYSGISISEPIANIDSVNFDSCLAVITAAETDSNAVIQLGTDILLDINTITDFLSSSDCSFVVRVGVNGSRFRTESSRYFPACDSVVVIYFPDSAELSFNLVGGNHDGYLSFSRYEPIGSDFDTYESAVPLVAALIPNPSKDVNYIGALTTSLYYRFDHDRLPLYFNGDRIQTAYSLNADDTSRSRLFPYDADKGRRLFSQLPNRPRRITMYVGNPVLQSVADYFSDILARDRCRTEVVTDISQADIALAFVPYVEGIPTEAFRSVLDIIGFMTPSDWQSEIIGTAKTQLTWAEDEADSLKEAYYLRRVERRLVDDLGVFPLFQPTIFVGTESMIKGIQIDEFGRVDLSKIRRVQLPSPSEGGVE